MLERAPRFPAKYPIVFRQGPEMHTATICNISKSGGCIHGPNSLSKGDVIVLDYSFGQTRAVVIWSMERLAGLQFESHLSSFGLTSIRASLEPEKVPA